MKTFKKIKIILLLGLIFSSALCFSQKDTISKVSFITMINFGVLYPNYVWEINEKYDHGAYSNFKVKPTLGFNTNLLAGISIKIFKNCNFESLFGIGYSKNNYQKTGIRISNSGYAGVDTFIGTINESTIEKSLVLTNGLTFYNTYNKRNKFSFSNYISTSMFFDKVFITDSKADSDKISYKNNLHTKHLKFMLYSTHLISYTLNIKKYECRIGAGINLYLKKYNKGYLNPLMNLTIKI